MSLWLKSIYNILMRHRHSITNEILLKLAVFMEASLEIPQKISPLCKLISILFVRTVCVCTAAHWVYRTSYKTCIDLYGIQCMHKLLYHIRLSDWKNAKCWSSSTVSAAALCTFWFSSSIKASNDVRNSIFHAFWSALQLNLLAIRSNQHKRTLQMKQKKTNVIITYVFQYIFAQFSLLLVKAYLNVESPAFNNAIMFTLGSKMICSTRRTFSGASLKTKHKMAVITLNSFDPSVPVASKLAAVIK